MDAIGSITIFDAIILAVIVFSLFVGFTRGFTCEILTLGAWGGAILLTLYAMPWATGIGRGIFSPEPLADLVTMVVLFLLSVIILKLIAKYIGDHIKKSAVGPLDRAGGAFFGILRGALVISATYLALSYFIPYSKQPNWIKDARLHQVAAYGAEILSTILPEFGGSDALGSNITIEDIRNQMPVGVDFDMKSITKDEGYTDKVRDSINDLIEDATAEKNPEPS